MLPKRNLIRIVRTTQGVKIDPSGKMSGRGAYLHDQRSCWDNGLRGALAGALKTELTVDDREYLLTFAAKLANPEEIQLTSHSPKAAAADPKQ